MTQPPQFNYYQPAEAPDPLAAARRASVPMFILGLVLAGFGLCSIISVWQMAPEQLLKQQSELMGSAAQTGLAPETFKTVGIAMHGVIVLVRTFLSFSLDVEMDGVVPWRRRASERGAGPSAATD